MKKITLLLVMLLAVVGGVKADVEWTIFSGSMAAGNFTTALYADATWCKALEAGDQLVGTATIDEGKESDYSIQLYYGWELISNFTYSEGTISYTLTADDITKLQTTDKGMRVRGKNITLTSLKVKKTKSAIKTTISATGSTGSWSSNVSFPENSLANAVKGDYVLVSLSSSASDSQGKVGMSSYGTDTYNFNNYVQAFAGVVTSDMAGESTKNGYVQGQNITVSGAALYHPLSSFSIGSIGYATFSASQQVTAPASVKAYKATVDVDGSTVKLTQFTGNVIPANTGAIIAGDEGAVLEFTASSASTSETSDLIACTTATDVSTLASGYDYYVLYPGTGESETNLELSTLLGSISDWGGKVTVSNSEPYTAEWTSSSTSSAMGKWLGSDWSSYDILRLVFTSNTVTETVHFGLSYNDQGNSENTGADLAIGELTVDIPLNASHKSAMGNFSFNSNATSGSLTFESAALIDSDGATVAEFRKTTSGTLAANKAYLKIPSSSARALDIVFDDGNTTAISSVENPVINDNVYYNLRGQRIANPTKGLYIVNGKKVIIK